MTDTTLEISHPRLQRLYQYWSAKRGQRKMPSRADIAVSDIAYVVGDVMLVDVIDGAPPRFRIRLHGTNLAERAGHEITGKMLDELPSRSVASAMASSTAGPTATNRSSCRSPPMARGSTWSWWH